MITYAVAILCVFGLAVGQILFKISAIALTESKTIFAFKPVAILFVAFFFFMALHHWRGFGYCRK